MLDRRQERWILYRLNEDDMFLRFLFLAIEEKISPDLAKADAERLGTFAGRIRPCNVREKKGKSERSAAKSLR